MNMMKKLQGRNFYDNLYFFKDVLYRLFLYNGADCTGG